MSKKISLKSKFDKLLKDENIRTSYVRLFDIFDDCPEFDLKDVVFLSIIISYELNNQECYLSYSEWMKKLKYTSKTSVGALAKRLKKDGWIYWERRYDDSNIYHPTDKLWSFLINKILKTTPPEPVKNNEKPKDDYPDFN